MIPPLEVLFMVVFFCIVLYYEVYCVILYRTIYGKKPSNEIFISLCIYGIRWSNKKKSFPQNSSKKAVKYLLNNCFLKLRTTYFRWVIGINMNRDLTLF